jgi:hypothetical protein
MTEFQSCLFTEIDTHSAQRKWAVSTAAPFVVGVRILNCQFIETDRGVGVLDRGCDNWIIGDNSRFVRMRGVGVELRSSGVTVREARFENKQHGAGPSPFIRVSGDLVSPLHVINGKVQEDERGFDGGQSEITGCRFGGEVGKNDFGPPISAIEFGPNIRELIDVKTKEKQDVDVPIRGMMISRNRFFGRTNRAGDEPEDGGPKNDSARHAISLRAPVQHSIVAENYFRRYFGAVIEETPASATERSESNIFVGNAVEREETPQGLPYNGLFSAGGASWQRWPPGQD